MTVFSQVCLALPDWNLLDLKPMPQEGTMNF